MNNPLPKEKNKTFTLFDNENGNSYEIPVIEGTVGPDVLDITNLFKESGLFTYDPGFTSTASCKSGITYIDGEQGILRHRGYDIKELAENSNFMEVCYLLLHSELPSPEDFSKFDNLIKNHTMINEQLVYLYRGFKRAAHPMAIMVGVVGALSAFYHDSTDINDPNQRMIASHRLIAKMPTIAAMAYKYSIGQPYIYPNNELSYSENFLNMMFAVPTQKFTIDKTLVKAMDRFFILHADHEQNASTSTVRLAGSSNANPFACIAAGIASLWGPAHGGANEAVIKMLTEINSKDNIDQYLLRAKDKNDPFRLMGFGHRVYKNYDPRASVMKDTCHEVLEILNIKNDPLLDIALELENIALNDEYFIEKKLYPNVDFYSGIIYRAMGIPTNMFTVMFALGRLPGWLAHWNEMINSPDFRINRPRQVYTGKTKRNL